MRRVRRKGGNKEKVFGCDLLEYLTASSQGIPLVLRCCSEFVEQHGIVDGIYRLSGVSSNIQKLRGEFESDGSPDLNKDVYLQDIHCVSSLCKAYFRELPNPLLTYQLYDKFAEAVAIQLEEERLVKIKDVLKELPAPHYRTLEFLMRHLVKMASYSTETNMHARNLAIVWAPNLLRSKDIEASGFNGTAAFMEVRVQSIVVEFILTHVPQLFPEEGVSSERRKSLPSPSAMPSQEEGFFRSAQPNFGNISPGDGPLPIRPYHAIIEGTDKRKGSLKGRRWMSIFNIGGRIQDQRRRHKHSTKEKERPALRPARSMDSLSTPSFPNEGTRRSGQRPPSTNMSPLVTPSTQTGSDAAAPSGGLGSSEYAVTYRRGTGLVSGSAGTPGTYTALDPEGLGLPANEGVQTRSPGLSSKASRRAAMHITGPTMVTVPLHITSNLALGVLQGGGSDRIILRGRDKDGGEKVEGKEKGEKIERKECRGMEWNVEESRKVEEEEKPRRAKETVDVEENKESAGGVREEKGEEAEEKPDEEVYDKTVKPVIRVQDVSREQRATSVNSKTEDGDEDAAEDAQDSDSSEYMDMKREGQHSDTRHGNDGVFDASHILNSTEVEGDDHELSGYVQDNFDFLDQMDCSVLDHMDSSVSCQVNEFSVEPPGHSDDEYELMEQPSPQPGLQRPSQLSPDVYTQNQTELNPHRPISLDLTSRHTKSLSLPYMTSPIHEPEESFSEGEVSGDDSDDNLYDSEEDESMFIKSLPSDFFLNNLSRLKPDTDTDTQDSSRNRSPAHEFQSSEAPDLNLELSACKQTTSGDEGQIEADGRADEDKLEVQQIEKKGDDEDHCGGDQLENDMQSRATEEPLSIMKNVQSEKSLTSDASPTCSEKFQFHSNEDNNELNTLTGKRLEDVREIVEIPPPQVAPYNTLKETADAPSEESSETPVIPMPHPRGCVRGDAAEREDGSQQSDENMREELSERGGERIADKMHEGCKEQASSICTNIDIWNELEDVVCEVIEDEESKKWEEAAAMAHLVENEEEKEQRAGDSKQKTVEVDESKPNKTDIKEEEEESLDKTVGTLTDPVMQQESEEDETDLPRSELEKVEQEKHGLSEEARHQNREVVPEETEKNKEKEDVKSRAQPSVDMLLPVIISDSKEPKGNQMCDNSDGNLGGFGRKLVTSKHPKVYQVKAVPVVPPKPQHCKITALTLRQQQQQRERREADRGRDTTLRALTEQDRVSSAEQLRDRDEESADRKERPVLLRERERRRDGAEGAARDTSRNSPLSMCFDEAVAIATMRREKERVREGEAEAEGSGK